MKFIFGKYVEYVMVQKTFFALKRLKRFFEVNLTIFLLRKKNSNSLNEDQICIEYAKPTL